jgi:hypothetical protein
MQAQSPGPHTPDDDDRAARRRYWRRKLGRLRLGAEPIEEQLARYRRVTWMLTAIPIGIGLMFVGLFAAFDRPDVGALLSAVLLAPVVLVAWADDALLRARARRYLRECADPERRRTASGRD